jgi:four helix bundle protein
MARSSVYECVALLHLLQDLGQLEEKKYHDYYSRYEQLSKMLLGMYRSKV